MSTSLTIAVPIVLPVLLFCLAPCASADLVELRSGEIFSGLEVQSYESSRGVFWIAKEGKKVRIPADQVAGIDFDSPTLTQDVVGPEGALEGEPVHRYDGETRAFLLRRGNRLAPVTFEALRFHRGDSDRVAVATEEVEEIGSPTLRNPLLSPVSRTPFAEVPETLAPEIPSQVGRPLTEDIPLVPYSSPGGVESTRWSDSDLYSNVKISEEAARSDSPTSPGSYQPVKYIARWKGQGATAGSGKTTATPSPAAKSKVSTAAAPKKEHKRREPSPSKRERSGSSRGSRSSSQGMDENENPSESRSRSSRSSRSRSSTGGSSNSGGEYGSSSGSGGYSGGNGYSSGYNGSSNGGY